MIYFNIKSFVLLLNLLNLSISIAKSQYDTITCTREISTISGNWDNAEASIGCPSGYTLTGCSAYSSGGNLDGSWIYNNYCYARNGHGGTGMYIF